MKMRYRPLRGQEFDLKDGRVVKVVEVLEEGRGQMVSVVLPNGKLTAVHKNELDLKIIDTKDYEKITE